jgi:ubiquinone/menaquinone biosynthesis C-methylase UbiE
MAGGDDPADEREYLLGTGDGELRRLALQHRVWAGQAFALWERAGFGRGHTVLDLGCGPGFATVDLAHLVGPEGRVVAADASPRFLAHLRRVADFHGLDWIVTVESDAERLDLSAVSEQAAFLDGAYCRWLLCYLAAPEAAVAAVARHLEPGGRFAATDYFNYRAFTLAPASAAFSAVVAAVPEMWRASGGDLDVGGRLPALMRQAGLEPVEVRQVVRTARPGSALWAWPETFFRGFLPRLVEARLVDEATQDAFWDDWRRRAADPDAFLALPPQVEVVAEKR